MEEAYYDTQNNQVVVDAVSRLRQIKISFYYHCLNVVWRCIRKHKGYESIQRLVNSKT